MKNKESNKGTTIIKHRHDKYTILPKEVTNGKAGLSLRAVGLLAHVLGQPDDWQVWSRAVAKQFGCSRNTIQDLLNELRRAGYAYLEHYRDERGRLHGKVWRISDEPEFVEANKSVRIPLSYAQRRAHRKLETPAIGESDYRRVRLSESPTIGKSDGRSITPLQSNDSSQSNDAAHSTEKKDKKTTNTKAAPSARGGGSFFESLSGTSEPSSNADGTPSSNGAVKLSRPRPTPVLEESGSTEELYAKWKQCYSLWFLSQYDTTGTQKQKDLAALQQYGSCLSDNEMTLFMLHVMAGWIDSCNFGPIGKKHHKAFYRKKCVTLAFALKYRDELANELEVQGSAALASGYGELTAVIRDGHKTYLDSLEGA